MIEAIRQAWCAETSAAKIYDTGNAAEGQCAVTALVVQDWLGGDLLRADVPCYGSHYWNAIPGMGEVDLTRDQFPHEWILPRGEVVPRSRLLEGSRATNSRTPQRYELLKQRIAEIAAVQADSLTSTRQQLAAVTAARDELATIAKAWASDSWRESTAFSRIDELRKVGTP